MEKYQLERIQDEELDCPPGFEHVRHQLVEEDDDGPPPGFEKILSKDKGTANKQGDVEDGPPPGWELTSLARALPTFPSRNKDVEDDGPPPGFTFSALPKQQSCSSDKKSKSADGGDDEGPPPGFESVQPRQVPPPCMPQVQPLSNVSSDLEMENKQEFAKTNEKDPQTVSQPALSPAESRTNSPVQQPQPSTLPGETVRRERIRVKRPAKKFTSAQQMPSPAPQSTEPAATSSASEQESLQLVCGICQELLTYPRGERLVQCPSCEEVNYVMEAHEIGQVACKSCHLLLMYQYGALAVKCSICHTVTEIGEHNRRAPLSEQQGQGQRRRRILRRGDRI